MRTVHVALLIAGIGLSASGQFFSKAEKAAKEQEAQVVLKTDLSVAQQRLVYTEFCEAERTAELKAAQMHPIKIHQTPDVRKAQQQKADQTKASLMDLYKKEIAEKHQIGPEYLDTIVAAGKKEQWPGAAPAPASE